MINQEPMPLLLPEPGDIKSGQPRNRNIVLFVGLLAFWLALVGAVDFPRVIVGALVAATLVAIWSRRLQTGPAEADVPMLQLFARPAAFRYLAHMAIEILKANWMVAQIVLSPKPPIAPHFVLTKTKLTRNLTRVIFAHSITITPGTISVNLDGDDLIIHAINWEAAQGVRGWAIEDQIKELEAAWSR